MLDLSAILRMRIGLVRCGGGGSYGTGGGVGDISIAGGTALRRRNGRSCGQIIVVYQMRRGRTDDTGIASSVSAIDFAVHIIVVLGCGGRISISGCLIRWRRWQLPRIIRYWHGRLGFLLSCL